MAQDTHRFDPTAIREYDIRGVVGRTLSARDAYAVGRGFGTMVKEAVAAGPPSAMTGG
jgi:phosphomannomutase